MANQSRRCKAVKANGGRCRSFALHDSEYCNYHDPRKVAEREKAAEEWRQESGVGQRILRSLKHRLVSVGLVNIFFFLLAVVFYLLNFMAEEEGVGETVEAASPTMVEFLIFGFLIKVPIGILLALVITSRRILGAIVGFLFVIIDLAGTVYFNTASVEYVPEYYSGLFDTFVLFVFLGFAIAAGVVGYFAGDMVDPL